MRQQTTIVIDDDLLICELLSTLLTRLGYEVLGTAVDGRTGVQLFKETRPDFVICDIQMPVMSGADALKRILKIDPDAIVIMNTTADETFVAESCMQAGAKDFLSKGIPPGELLVKLSDTIKKHLPA